MIEEAASQLLESQDFRFASCESLLQQAPCHKHRVRVANRTADKASGDVILIGLYTHGPMSGLTIYTNQYPIFCRYMNAFMHHHCLKNPRAATPEPVWTSLSISRNRAVRPHLDAHNLAGSQNYTISFGSFQGGELWLEVRDNLGPGSPQSVVYRRKPNGQFCPGTLVSTFQKAFVFDPKQYHATAKWTGYRISITAYVSRSAPVMPQALLKTLQHLRFPYDLASNPSSMLVQQPDPLTTASTPASDATSSCAAPLTQPFTAEVSLSKTTMVPADYLRFRIAIVIEETPAVSTVLQQMGWQVEHLHHNHLRGTVAVHVPQRLRNHQVHALWVDFPCKGRHVKADNLHTCLVQLSTWLKHAKEAGIPAMLFGAYGSQWLAAPVADSVGQGILRKSYHRICHFGLKVDPQNSSPSKTCFVGASTNPVPSHQCQCQVPQQKHVLDWTSAPHSRRLRMQAHVAVAASVSRAWLPQQHTTPQRSTPDNSVSKDKSFDLLLARDGGPSVAPPFSILSSQPLSAAPQAQPLSQPSPLTPQPAHQAPLLAQSETVTSEEQQTSSSSCFPTEARIQQKERAKMLKARGLTPAKRKVTVEDHHDDVGTCLDSLAPYLGGDVEAIKKQQHDALFLCADALPPEWILGSTADPNVGPQPLTCYVAAHLADLSAHIQTWPPGGSDILYFGGGRHGCSTFAVQRTYITTTTREALTLLHTDDTLAIDTLGVYMHKHRPLVALLAPNPDDRTAVCLANAAASFQLGAGMFVVGEQGYDSPLYLCKPWASLLRLPSTSQMLTSSHGRPTRHLCANHPALLSPTRALLASQTVHVAPNGPLPPNVAESLADGVSLLKACLLLQGMPCASLYPSVASGPGAARADEAPPPPTEEQWRKCAGCRGRQNRWDDRHSRVRGECKFPDDETITWNCPGCKVHRPKSHSSHTYGPDCKHAVVESRTGSKRAGRHPRAPEVPASAAATADLQAQLPEELGDLGEAEERAAEEEELDIRPMSSGDEAAPAPAGEAAPESPGTGAEPSSGSGLRAPRSRRSFQDAGSGPERAADWTRYDISRSLRVLRTGSENAIMVELRKLHLRLWHAGRQSMTAILRSAGLGAKVLDCVPKVIQTCRECRNWQPPKPNTQHSLSVSLRCNEHVEVDLLFYRDHIIFHGIDRATRWHAAVPTASKEGETLFEALSTCWLTIHGPPQTLVCDGEGGLWRPEIAARIRRLGTDLKLRAPEQHARYIERRGAVLRATLHVLEDQLEREELVYPFPAVLAEAVFAGNACTHVGGATPYQAVYGRQPAMLPPLEAPDLPNLEESSEAGDLQRARVRAAALQSMIQASTMAKLSRASRAKTSHPTERMFQEGDLVDIFRKPSSKDASGWSGPYRVVKVEPGQVIVKIRGVDRTYRAQDTRHTLLVFHTVGHNPDSSECLQVVVEALESLSSGVVQTYGMLQTSDKSWKLTGTSRNKPHVLRALEHLFTNVWRLSESPAARLARGARTLPVAPGGSHSTVLWWFKRPDVDVQVDQVDSTRVDLYEIIGSEYPRAYVVQAIHLADQDITLADATEEAAEVTHESLHEDFIPEPDSAPPSVHTPHDTLSTIEEGSEEEAMLAYLSSLPCEVPDVRAALQELFFWDSVETLEESPENREGPLSALFMAPCEAEPIPEPLLQYYQLGVGPENYMKLNEHDELGNGYVELWFSREFSKVIGDDSQLGPDETYVLRSYASGFRNAVIQRDSDLLTPEEIKSHATEVGAASLEELRIWDRYGCFARTPRKHAHNVMDSRFVSKWKLIKNEAGQEKRIIRMRLALRGFKDLQADELEAHSATASRQSQRCLCSEAACHPDWMFIALDINKAFLQGLTYREIHELTGEEEREVCFTLPPGSAQYLRQIPGFENFDERTEVLKCIKPGTGCKDAPRAFSMKLAKFTRHPKIGLKPALYDGELELKFRDGRLVLMLAKHVDDLKVAGEPQEVKNLIAHLESGFGKLTYSEGTFTNCGLRHCRLEDGTIQMDQNEYISAMRPIRHPELTGRPSSDPCTSEVHGLYMSLLGAVAYALISQAWAAVFVISLQRRTSNPLNIHVRRLNILLAAMQKLKCNLVFPAMTCARKLLAYSDASFDKESESKGYGMRGTVFLRMGTQAGGKSVCHLLDAQSQSLKLVTRSTFSSETLAAVGTVDNLVPWLFTLHEVHTGPLTPEQARGLRERGGFSMESELLVDAMNLFHALTATYPKPPAEKTLYAHLAWLRDLMQCNIPNVVTWCDTRDMLADAMTKGKVSRDAILAAMRGKHVTHHEAKQYRKPVPVSAPDA